ncbi:DUF3592 domain-containing protein [Streptomyces carpinensis]|uniref:DUF3592 domain-containing protein n=2 Tax=Streptomyces carpinensis TaxID=66369 RepID=A0ABV1W076_9ACTN
MPHPWPTVSLLFGTFWVIVGAHGTHAALRARRSLRLLGAPGVQMVGEVANDSRRVGPSYHPPQIRYQAPPIGRPDAPAVHTYRQVPLNTDAPNALHRGTPVLLRYDPRDPRRAVVVRRKKAYSPTANLAWCVFCLVAGMVGLGAAALL